MDVNKRPHSLFTLILAVVLTAGAALAIWQLSLVNNDGGTEIPLASQPDASSTPALLAYHSENYGFDFQYPSNWTAPEKDDFYLIFWEPGNKERAALTLDLNCIFATGFEDAEKVRTTDDKLVAGDNEYVDHQTFVTTQGVEEIALRQISLVFPTGYVKAHKLNSGCSSASFIVGANISDSLLKKILGSFKFTK